jgi:hypothetical protein
VGRQPEYTWLKEKEKSEPLIALTHSQGILGSVYPLLVRGGGEEKITVQNSCFY